jgi:hypothetical protein
MGDDAPDDTIARAFAEEPQAADLLLRNRYRDRLHLSAAAMDNEPWDEIQANMEIWRLDEKKQKLDNKRMEQQNGTT